MGRHSELSAGALPSWEITSQACRHSFHLSREVLRSNSSNPAPFAAGIDLLSVFQSSSAASDQEMLPAALSPAGRSPQSRARLQARLLSVVSVLLHIQYEAGLYLSPLPKLANSEGTADSWAPRAEQDGAGRRAV